LWVAFIKMAPKNCYTDVCDQGQGIVGQLIPWTIDPMPFLTWVNFWSNIVLPDWTFGPILFLTGVDEDPFSLI